MTIVPDVSVCQSSLFPDEPTDATSALHARAGLGVVVPAHRPCKIANGPLIADQRGRTDAGVIGLWSAQIEALTGEVEALRADTGLRLLPLARVHGLTIYHTAYLELARRRGPALATFDKALIRAARLAGVPLAMEPA